MAAFCLVHGAWHGGWSWELVVPQLEAAGHVVVAPDLPCDDVEADFSTYAHVVLAALDADEPPIVVGHSLGGWTIPLVASRAPVRRLVFVCASVPLVVETPDMPERMDPRFFDGTVEDDLGRSVWPEEAAVSSMYRELDPQLARAAARRLRPQAFGSVQARYPLASLPAVPTTSIICAGDRSFRPAWSTWAARTQLGVEPVVLRGGHFPMYEQPSDLARLLLDLAA